MMATYYTYQLHKNNKIYRDISTSFTIPPKHFSNLLNRPLSSLNKFMPFCVVHQVKEDNKGKLSPSNKHWITGSTQMSLKNQRVYLPFRTCNIPLSFSRIFPAQLPTYYTSPEESAKIKQKITHSMENGKIKPSASSCSFYTLVIPKKIQKEWCLCIICRTLKKVTIKNQYPVPRMMTFLIS